MGSGCDSVGRAVASDTGGPRLETSHRQNFIIIIFSVEKTKIKKKDTGNGAFLKQFNQVNDHICASSGCDEYFTFDDRNFEAKLGTGID